MQEILSSIRHKQFTKEHLKIRTFLSEEKKSTKMAAIVVKVARIIIVGVKKLKVFVPLFVVAKSV